MKHTSRLTTGIDKCVMAALPMCGVLPRPLRERLEEDYETNVCTCRAWFRNILPTYKGEDDLRGTAEVLARQMSQDLAYEDYVELLRRQEGLDFEELRKMAGFSVRRDVWRQLRDNSEPLDIDAFFKHPERPRLGTTHGKSIYRPRHQTKCMEEIFERAMYSSPYDRWKAMRALDPEGSVPMVGKVVACRHEALRNPPDHVALAAVVGVNPQMGLVTYNGRERNFFSSDIKGNVCDIDLAAHEKRRKQLIAANKRKRGRYAGRRRY